MGLRRKTSHYSRSNPKRWHALPARYGWCSFRKHCTLELSYFQVRRPPRRTKRFRLPRRYLGEISSVDEPLMIVGLLKELEYQAGALWPAERRVMCIGRQLRSSAPMYRASSLFTPRNVE